MKTSFTREKAEKVISLLRKRLSKVGKFEVCGSYRRGKPILHDIDIVGSNPKIISVLEGLGEKVKGGDKQASVMIKGIQVDIIIATRDSWGSSILFSTGSASHNIWLRAEAKRRGLKLNRNGLWFGDVNVAKGDKEEGIYLHLGQRYHKPEERG